MVARKKPAGAAPPVRYKCKTERVDPRHVDNLTYRVWRIGERPRSMYSLWRPHPWPNFSSDDDRLTPSQLSDAQKAFRWKLAPGLKPESRDAALLVERIHPELWVVYGHNDFNTEKKPETRHKTKAEAIAAARERLGGCPKPDTKTKAGLGGCGYRDRTCATRRTKRK